MVQGLGLLLFTLFGAAIGFYLGTKRVRRRSVFGEDHIGSPTHRRIMARRQLMRVVSTVIYGMAGLLVGFAFLMITTRR